MRTKDPQNPWNTILKDPELKKVPDPKIAEMIAKEEEMRTLQRRLKDSLRTIRSDGGVNTERFRTRFSHLSKLYKEILQSNPDNKACKTYEDFVSEDNLQKLEKRGPVMKGFIVVIRAVLSQIGLGDFVKKLTSKKQKVADSLIKDAKAKRASIGKSL